MVEPLDKLFWGCQYIYISDWYGIWSVATADSYG